MNNLTGSLPGVHPRLLVRTDDQRSVAGRNLLGLVYSQFLLISGSVWLMNGSNGRK